MRGILIWSLLLACTPAFSLGEAASAQPGTSTASAASARLVDRLNRPWPSAEQIRRSRSYIAASAASTTCAGGFILFFEDVALGNHLGFDDPSLGTIRQLTACAVLDDLAAQVIDLGGSTPDIVVEASDNDGTGPIAGGSAFYPASPPPGFLGGTLFDHITTGVDPTPATGSYDARIQVDFGPRQIGSASVGIHSDHTTSPGGQLDLYSILLHETMHALGFASFLQANGASLHGAAYSRFDRFLVNGAGTALVHPTTALFQGSPADLISNAAAYKGFNPLPPAVYSPAVFQPGSSLSHFDSFRDGEQYLMRPSTSGGADRQITPPEIGVLCDLGYVLQGNQCSNHAPVGTNDTATTTLGGQVCTNVLANDSDLDGDPISIDPGTVQVINGGGTFTISGNQICYMASPAFAGTATIVYRPADGDKTGNKTLLSVVIPASFCPGDACNLACNGGFETGISLAAFETFPIFNDFNSCAPGNNSNVDRWCSTVGTADLFIRGSQKPGPTGPSHQGIPKNFFTLNAPGGQVDTHTGPGNDRYVGGYQTGGNIEGIFTRLIAPLVPSAPYEISFYSDRVRQSGPGGNGSFLVSLDSVMPPRNFGSDQNTPLSSQAETWSVTTALNTWTQSSLTVTVQTSTLQYLVLEPKSQAGTAIGDYVFLDDVSVHRIGPEFKISKTVSDSQPRLGQTIHFSLQICNVGSVGATNVVVQDLLPPGLSYVSGFSSYPTHTLASLPAGQCQTVTLTATVATTAPVNQTITNCAAVVSAGSNCGSLANASNCGDLVVPAADVAVSKTVSPAAVAPGQQVAFSVTVSNLGPGVATNVVVQDVLPPGLAYVSHAIAGGPATFNASTGLLTIPALANGGSRTLQINARVTRCGLHENVAVLQGFDGTDLNTINNQAAASLVVSGEGCGSLCTSPPDGMAAWWPLNETGGTTADDVAGPNPGQHIHGPTPTTGQVGGGLRFDGTDDYVEAADHPSVDFGPAQANGSGDFSIDAWIRVRNPITVSLSPIVDKRLNTISTTQGYFLFLYGGDLSFQLADGAGSPSCAASPTAACTNYFSGISVADNRWHHIAVTVERTNPNGGRWYVDGQPVGSPFDPTLQPGSLANARPLRLGATTVPAVEYLRGELDEVEIFRRVLTAQEVALLYQAGLAGAGKCLDSCTGTWEAACVSPGSASAAVKICNNSTAAHTYAWSVAGIATIPNSVCSVNGPSVYQPPGGQVTVPAGQCATAPFTAQCPAGQPAEAHGCFELSVVNLDEGVTFACSGSTLVTRRWFWKPDSLFYDVPLAADLDVMFQVTNLGTEPGTLDYELAAMPSDMQEHEPAMSLNGRPAGERVPGRISLGPGKTGRIRVNVAFTRAEPFLSYALLVLADLDGDGSAVPIASAGLRATFPDCNGNGVDDPMDIVRGTSADCDGNGVPDECDIANPENDCNRNGVPDRCDLAAGTSLDIDASDRPDECEVGSVFWVFHGTAQGGQVSTTIQGFSATCTVVFTTSAGQTAGMVAAAFAAALNTDSCLVAQGITTTASGQTVIVQGFRLTSDRVIVTIDDPGLVLSIPVVSIPALSFWGSVLLALGLAAAAWGAIAARRRQVPGSRPA